MVEGCVVGGVCLAYVGEYLGGVVGLGRVWGEVEEHKGVFTIFPFIPWYVCDFLVWKSPKRPIYYHFTVCFIVIFM